MDKSKNRLKTFFKNIGNLLREIILTPFQFIGNLFVDFCLFLVNFVDDFFLSKVHSLLIRFRDLVYPMHTTTTYTNENNESFNISKDYTQDFEEDGVVKYERDGVEYKKQFLVKYKLHDNDRIKFLNDVRKQIDNKKLGILEPTYARNLSVAFGYSPEKYTIERCYDSDGKLIFTGITQLNRKQEEESSKAITAQDEKDQIIKKVKCFMPNAFEDLPEQKNKEKYKIPAISMEIE